MSSTQLALHGGKPVRSAMLPYGRQQVDEADVAAVTAALRSNYLTTGPRVAQFEKDFAAFVGCSHAVAVSSGTAALHAAFHVLGLAPGDEVIVPTMTFAATANAVLYCGARPVFADVDPHTLLVDVAHVERLITRATRAVVAVDYAGQPCDYDALTALAGRHGVALLADACHALGASWNHKPVGTLASLSTFSLHPVKHMTTGEGGVITTQDADLAARLRVFRNHGITTDHATRERQQTHAYEMVELGFNYRLTDMQCALGSSQLGRVGAWVSRRRELAAAYHQRLRALPAFRPLGVHPRAEPSWHLMVVQLDPNLLRVDRDQVFEALRAENIGVNVHYLPVHLHRYYREKLGTRPGTCPVAEAAYPTLLTLPLFPGMTAQDLEDVVSALDKVQNAFG